MRKGEANRIRNQSGVTLIELIIVLIIFSILAAGIASYLSQSMRAFMAAKDGLAGLGISQYVDQRIAMEIREINFEGSGYSITDFTTDTLTFQNTDDVTTVQIKYDSASSRLLLDYASPAVQTLANNITDFVFTYYDKEGIAGATVSTVVFIEYSYTIAESATGFSTTSRVMLRDKI